ncbi:MAG: CcdB family protein [Stenotrophobium sp.]
MSQFDVYRNLQPTRELFPYLLDLQAEAVSMLETRIVAPLILRSKFSQPSRVINPVVSIQGRKYVVLVQEMAGLPKRQLGSAVTNLKEGRADFIAATDLLLTGI